MYFLEIICLHFGRKLKATQQKNEHVLIAQGKLNFYYYEKKLPYRNVFFIAY